jgi:preprotein translocase subunit Sec63
MDNTNKIKFHKSNLAICGSTTQSVKEKEQEVIAKAYRRKMKKGKAEYRESLIY